MRNWRRLGVVGGFLPLFLMGQVGVVGLKSAEACTGGGHGEDWDEVAVVPAGAARVSVGTDGFVLLGRAYYGELDSENPGAWVRVEDADGAPVAGHLEVLLTRERGDSTERYLGWQADEPVAVGAVLRLTSWRSEAESAEAEGNSIELEVVGDPTPLPVPTIAITRWLEVGHGVGERTDCEADGGTCAPYVVSVPSKEVLLVSVDTRWQLPAIESMVAWEAWAEASDPENGVRLGETSSRDVSLPSESVVISGRGNIQEVRTGIVAFAPDATDHCVVAVVKNLRTGEERRSEPLCEAEGEPTFTLRDHDLVECMDPPTAEALPLWCSGHGNDPRCESGSGGAGGQPATGGQPEAGEPGADAGRPGVGDDAGSKTEASGGCQLAPTRGSWAFALATLGAAAAWARRRWLSR